ncbi:hypothetical protein [Sporohalobacter salinus]|uniref:hypothetical protein n=1 Tax=Sporohalobacter salinus TaxID=1494606 RepID=UPI00195F30EB|nr:hypothetical protein [Sporohalobacter salinus]
MFPSSGNAKIEGNFKDLELNNFRGEIGVSGYRFILDEDASFKNSSLTRIQIPEVNNEIMELNPYELEIYFKSDAMKNNSDIVFSENSIFEFYDYNEEEKRIPEIDIKKVNFKRTNRIKRAEFKPFYRLTLEEEDLNFSMLTSFEDKLILDLPPEVEIRINDEGVTKKYSPSYLRILPIEDGETNGSINFIGKANKFKLNNSIQDLRPEEKYMNEKILVNGISDYFTLNSNFNTEMIFNQTGVPQEYSIPFTKITGKTNNNQKAEILFKYTYEDDYFKINGQMEELTFDDKSIIIDSIIEWIEKNRNVFLASVITAFVTSIITTIFSKTK